MGERRSIKSVLVVDDDDKLLRSYKRGAGGRTMFTANNPTSALEIVQDDGPDLAIVDLRLGEGSGIDLIRELRHESSNLQIVLCSGYLSVAATVTAVRAGADMVVFKPITLQEILRRVEENHEEPDLDETPTLARAEWEHIMRVLSDCDGNVTKAARRLGLYRSSLQRRLRKYAPKV